MTTSAADINWGADGDDRRTRRSDRHRDHGLVTVRLCDVKPERVGFIWPARIARRKLNLIVGDPGLGKSTITLDITARMTRGSAWPDGGHAPIADAVILSAEDDLADTIRPRLDALNADVTRVHAIQAVRTGESERPFSLMNDLTRLDAFLQEYAKVGIVVIDPLSAYLGADTDSYKDADVRAILAPLATLAAERNVAVVGVMHLGKGGQRPALYRVLGSIGFTAAARLVLAVAEHPDKDGRRILAPVKQNICAPSATLAFRLDDGRLTWDEGTVEGVDLDTVLGGGMSDHQERHDAVEWLRELLTDNGEMLAKDVKRAVSDAGIGWRSVEAAKAKLRVRTRRIGFSSNGRWYWRLPETATSYALAVNAVFDGNLNKSPETAIDRKDRKRTEQDDDAERL